MGILVGNSDLGLKLIARVVTVCIFLFQFEEEF